MSKSLEPLHPQAKLERRTLKFQAGVSGESIIESVMSLIPSITVPKMFRVCGFDDEGDFHRVDLDATPPDEFATDDVDQLVDEFVLKFDDISQSSYVETMLAALRDNPALLGREDE